MNVGVSLPSSIGTIYTLSWPFLRLEEDDESIVIHFRFRWVRRFAELSNWGQRFSSPIGTAIWSCRIDEIADVRIAPRSALVASRSGWCCIGIPFFVPGSVKKLSLVQGKLKALGVPLIYVSGNFTAMRSMRSP